MSAATPLELLSPVYANATAWDDARPWLPQPCDTPDTFAWFALYLALPPPRELRELARMGCRYESHRLAGIAEAALWRERAEAYDAHLAALRFATIEREVESAAEGHARRMAAIRAVTEFGAEEVRRLARIAARNPDHPGSIRPELAVRAVVHGVRTEALLLGVQAPEAAGEADLSDLSDEEIDQLASLTRKAEKSSSSPRK